MHVPPRLLPFFYLASKSLPNRVSEGRVWFFLVITLLADSKSLPIHDSSLRRYQVAGTSTAAALHAWDNVAIASDPGTPVFNTAFNTVFRSTASVRQTRDAIKVRFGC